MNIELTENQYKSLLKLAMLGDWVVNAVPVESENDSGEIIQYLFSRARDFGMEEYIEFDENENMYFHTDKLEDEMEITDAISDYHEFALWESIILEFSRRDLIKKYGEEAVENMSNEELVEKEYPFMAKYEEELRENGLANLSIKIPKKTKTGK